MIIRQLYIEERQEYNRAVNHPLQSWEWGEFRKKMGLKVIRLGGFEKDKLTQALQLTIHNIPKFNYTIAYLPKCQLPNENFLSALKEVASSYNSIFLKLEPDIGLEINNPELKTIETETKVYLENHGALSGRPLFTPYTFQIDLTLSEDQLLKNMKQKTRYNVGLAQKRGVEVVNDNSTEAFNLHLDLLEQTTKRQKFYAHNRAYHQTMWETLKPKAITHLLKASYQGEILATWIVFVFKKVLYYPYGASSRKHREVMASNLMMWEAIRFGKKLGCHTFDMWGCLGPHPDTRDPWYGFHNFKEGYGPKMIKFVGTYDLVVDPAKYRLYALAENLRWKWLKIKSSIPFLS